LGRCLNTPPRCGGKKTAVLEKSIAAGSNPPATPIQAGYNGVTRHIGKNVYENNAQKTLA
jgi:hypothetical protein